MIDTFRCRLCYPSLVYGISRSLYLPDMIIDLRLVSFNSASRTRWSIFAMLQNNLALPWKSFFYGLVKFRLELIHAVRAVGSVLTRNGGLVTVRLATETVQLDRRGVDIDIFERSELVTIRVQAYSSWVLINEGIRQVYAHFDDGVSIVVAEFISRTGEHEAVDGADHDRWYVIVAFFGFWKMMRDDLWAYDRTDKAPVER